MIYTEQANFPYPVLRNNSNDYNDPIFDFDVIDMSDVNGNFIIKIESKISSSFINKLIDSKKAKIFLIVKSKDSQFLEIPKIGEYEFSLSNKQISFHKKKTAMQLMIQCIEKIDFDSNNDLNAFYIDFKDKIEIEKGCVLAFSNVMELDSRQEKPYDLFGKTLDTDIKSDIKIELNSEVIDIRYKSEEMMLSELPKNRDLTNPYLYLGLERALIAFIMKYYDKDEVGEDLEMDSDLYINSIDEGSIQSPLDQKIFDLLNEKRIYKISIKNIDETIHLISDNIFKKYVKQIEEVYNNEN